MCSVACEERLTGCSQFASSTGKGTRVQRGHCVDARTEAHAQSRMSKCEL